MINDISILIIDNNKDFLDTWAETIQESGLLVLKALSLDQAHLILQKEKVDIAVIDVRMRNDNDATDNSGIEFAELEQYEHIPKIILTRYPNYEDVRKTLKPRINKRLIALNYLAKQEGPNALIQIIREIVEEELVVRIDERTHQLVIRGDRFELTPNETVLLSVLLRQKGRVCSRQEIARKMFPESAEYKELDNGPINDTVYYLRKKLDLISNNLLRIETMRSRGFVLHIRTTNKK